MTRKEWQAIEEARRILNLGERATLAEIKGAYRRLSKEHHPDTRVENPKADNEKMYELTAAYTLLMRYCEEYRFPLKPPEGDVYDAEDWWLDRFGQDPLWGRRR
ncbi:MAG: J domain-containing protein [Desulfobulbus sp.]|nr:MAG: J domain-containing protein [Desulfobulbus sp.]